jgi:DNA-binding CsgD family transcriptional regulator
MRGVDALSVVEAAYRFELDDMAWLHGIAQSAYEQIGAGLGIFGFEYQVGADGRITMGREVQIEMPDNVAAGMRANMAQLSPSFVAKSFARCEAATASQASDAEMRAINGPMFEALGATFGWYDSMMLGGMDPSGHGVYLGAWLPKATNLPSQVRATWSRVAVHLVTARRLRMRLAASAGPADAVLTPSGQLDEGCPEAKMAEARTALRNAVQDFERARTQLRRDQPAEAVNTWRGLVAGRWSLVDEFSSSGKRYVLARRNDVAVAGPESLTVRERQAVGYAALGHSNKLIAYEMGISDSTVGVLLHRAARRLGVSSRAELIERWRAQK